MQLAELDILIAFDKICKESGINYSLDSGTLLGAVRHKGFIPWDDDIDVAMPRPDYEKFYKLVTENKDILPDNLELVPDRGENALIPFLKLIDKNIKIDANAGEITENLWIDIFPYDGYPTDNKKAAKFWKKVHMCHRIILYNYNDCSNKRGLRKLALKLFSVYAKMCGVSKAIKKLNKLREKYPYSKAEIVGPVMWSSCGLKYRMPIDAYSKYTALEFEGYTFPAIEDWDAYLSHAYGDYMTLPPEDKRETHGIKSFRLSD